MENKEKYKPAVVLDIDGVVNSFSNKRFYASFAYHALHELAKMKSRKQLLRELPKMREMGGANSLFKFARYFCGDDETFRTYRHNLALKLDYNLIKHNPSLTEFMERLGSLSEIIVRSDGLSEVAYAAWQRVVGGQTSAQIKKEIIKQQNAPFKEAQLAGSSVRISGIVENDFITKPEGTASWQKFAQTHGIDIEKSVLIDDTKGNCRPAEELGMTIVHINRLDSLLEGSLLQNLMYKSLHDVLGKRMTKTLKSLGINHEQKPEVDIESVFAKLLVKEKS